MARFEMNPDLEKNLAVQVLEDMQRNVDDIHQKCKGQSADVVMDALQRAFGTAFVEPTLSNIANAISRGDHVTIEI